MRTVLFAMLLALSSCASGDPARAFLEHEAAYLRIGVSPQNEEQEVRRVLSQRGLRIVSRVENPFYVALGAATRDRSKSAVRLITGRGVVLADDASSDDLFAPGSVSLIEHFGGELGRYVLFAEARIARGQDVGCVTLQRILPDGNLAQCPLDVAPLGSRACVSNLAPGRGGHMQATIAWVGLHALTTPQLDVELAFAAPPSGEDPPLQPVAHIAPGPWLDREQRRLSTLPLGHANFSARHAAGVARAAVARLTGSNLITQADVYRNAVGEVLPGTPEAQVVSETNAHIARGWLDPSDESSLPPEDKVFGKPEADEGRAVSGEAAPGTEPVDADSFVVGPPETPRTPEPAEPDLVIEPR